MDTQQYQTLNCLQINLNHTRAATVNAANFVKEKGFQLVFLQDPLVYNDRLPGFPNYWRSYSSQNGQAWLVVTDHNLPITLLKKLHSSVFVRIETSPPLIMGSQYVSPVADIIQAFDEWKFILQDNQFSACNFLLAGDFNARSPIWGYSYEDDRGNFVIETCISNDFSILNSADDPPTFNYLNRRGWPDLTFIKFRDPLRILDWRVREDFTGSDHNFISFSITSKISRLHSNRYKTKYGNHSKFSRLFGSRARLLLDNLAKVSNAFELDSFTNSLISDIQECCNLTYKKKNFNPSKGFQWWTPELSSSRNKLSALKRRLNRVTDVALKQRIHCQYSKLRAEYRKLLSKTRSEAWRSFCELSRAKFGTLFRIGHDKVFKPHEILVDWPDAHLMDSFQVQSRLTTALFGNHTIPPSLPLSRPNTSGNPSVQKSEVAEALRTLNPNKAPGPDNIDVRILRQVHKTNAQLLYLWVKTCFDLGHFPSKLRAGHVVYFQKQDKNPSMVDAYRPICLLPTLGKLLEKVINVRLIYHLEKNGLLSPNQHGFRELRSCESALQDLLDLVDKNRNQGLLTTIVSFDIKGAFDSVDWLTLINRLIYLKCPSLLTNLIRSYLLDRKLLIQWGSNTTSHLLVKGCPQGSCLAPTLWLVIAEIVLQSYSTSSSKILAFADDFLLVSKGKNRVAVQTEAQLAIDHFIGVTDSLHLVISADKTKQMTIAPPRKRLKRYPTLRLPGNSIANTFTLRYLGVILQHTLNWSAHIRNVKAVVERQHISLLRVAGRSWGVSSSLRKLWYQTVTEKTLTYAAGIWAPRLNNNEKLLLQRAQRPFLLRITRTYKTTPTEALNVLAGIPPLSLTALAIAKTTQLLRLNKPVTFLTKEFNSDMVLSRAPNTHLHPADRHYPVISVHDGDRHSGITIFTDGSKTEEGVGAAFVVRIGGRVTFTWASSLIRECTVFQAELAAIGEALAWINQQNPTGEVTILSDSQSSLKAIAKFRQSNSTIQKIQNLLHRLNTPDRPIRIAWIKGHAGNIGNEQADSLAREATSNSSARLELPLSPTYVRGMAKAEVLHCWQASWDASEKGRYLYVYLPKVTTERLFDSFALNCFLTNHGPFPEYLNRFHLVTHSSGSCVCGARGDALHYVFDCPLTVSLHFRRPAVANNMTWAEQINKNKTLRIKALKLYNWILTNQEHILSP